jgi:hypothetical protein
MLRRILNLCCRDDTAPFHIEGHGRANGSNGCNRWIGEAQATWQPQSLGHRVGDVMVIIDVQVVHAQMSSSFVEVNFDRVFIHFDHPEYVVGIDVHVEVMNLACQSNRTGVQVKSNEGEGTAALVTVYVDELALPKAHVCLVGERHGGTHRVRSSSLTSDVRKTHKPVEVCNLRRVVNFCQRNEGIQRVVVDDGPEGVEWCATPGNWLEPGALAPLSVFIFVAGIGWIGNHETGSQRCPRRSANQIATAHPIPLRFLQ